MKQEMSDYVRSLIEDNTRLVWNIVKRFYGRGYDADDLYQTGCVGLVKAANKFDISLGLKFSTYAVPVITGEILQMLRDDSMIKVSRSVKMTARDVRNAKRKLECQLGREPTISEISNELDIPSEKITEALSAVNHVFSIDSGGTNSSGTENDAASLINTIETTGWGSESDMIDRIQLAEILYKLSEIERKVIVSRYVVGKTQTETANELGMTQVAISRLEKKIKKQINSEYNLL